MPYSSRCEAPDLLFVLLVGLEVVGALLEVWPVLASMFGGAATLIVEVAPSADSPVSNHDRRDTGSSELPGTALRELPPVSLWPSSLPGPGTDAPSSFPDEDSAVVPALAAVDCDFSDK